MKKLNVRKDERCMACLSCVMACSEAFYKVADPGLSCIQIVEKNGEPKVNNCIQCGKCMRTCEHEAITQNPKTGVYMINKKKCVGCGKCVEACPMKVMVQMYGAWKQFRYSKAGYWVMTVAGILITAVIGTVLKGFIFG